MFEVPVDISIERYVVTAPRRARVVNHDDLIRLDFRRQEACRPPGKRPVLGLKELLLVGVGPSLLIAKTYVLKDMNSIVGSVSGEEFSGVVQSLYVLI